MKETITITGTSIDGQSYREIFPFDIEEIDLTDSSTRPKIQSIDLTPLHECINLRKLMIGSSIETLHIVFDSYQKERITTGAILELPTDQMLEWFKYSIIPSLIVGDKAFKKIILYVTPIQVEKSRRLLKENFQQNPNEPIRKIEEALFSDTFEVAKVQLVSAYRDIPKKDLFFIGYLTFGTIFVLGFVFLDIGGSFGWMVANSLVEPLLLLFIGFQLFQGLMIQVYIDSLLDKAEQAWSLTFGLWETVVLSPSFTRLSDFLLLIGIVPVVILGGIYQYISKHFGAILGLLWSLTIYSIIKDINSYPRNEIANTSRNWLILSTLNDLWAWFLEQIQFSFSIPYLPLFHELVHFLFTGFLISFIRVLGVLVMFYAVYKQGWKILVQPSGMEVRKDEGGSARLDWHERLALLLGILVALLTIVYDQTPIAQLPIDSLKIGIVIGGIAYVLVYRKQFPPFIKMIISIILLYAILKFIEFLLMFLFIGVGIYTLLDRMIILVGVFIASFLFILFPMFFIMTFMDDMADFSTHFFGESVSFLSPYKTPFEYCFWILLLYFVAIVPLTIPLTLISGSGPIPIFTNLIINILLSNFVIALFVMIFGKYLKKIECKVFPSIKSYRLLSDNFSYFLFYLILFLGTSLYILVILQLFFL